MASPDPPNFQKYGVPIYASSCVPVGVLTSASDGDKPSDDVDSPPPADSNPKLYIALAGGGGEGHSGIPNALLTCCFDLTSNSLSDQPVMKLETGTDLPYRMAVHPRGEGIICSFPKNCRWFEWDTRHGNHDLGVESSERTLEPLEDVGQQLALTFSEDGSLLAIGGEDGYLRVFKWPSMEIVLSDERAHSSVKDLDFSQDGKFLVSVGSGAGGPCRVWHVASPGVLTSLPKENDEMFGYCRFSQKSDGSQVLYTTTNHAKGGNIVQWNATTWRRICSKQIVRDPISSFNVSNDGKLLAIGTIQGDILVINSASMVVKMTVKKAHLGLVTTLVFSADSRALISASMDSSVRVTIIKDMQKEGFNYWIIILTVLLALIISFIVYRLKTLGLLPIP